MRARFSYILVALACLAFGTHAAGLTVNQDLTYQGTNLLFERHQTTPRHLTSNQIRRDLGKKLSKTTIIYGPEDAQFANATSRYSAFAKPNVSVVILPGEESDVATIVKYANSKSIPFYASSGRHGFTHSISTFDSGIEISLRQLNSVTIISPSSSKKKTAQIGGGAIVRDIIHPLWSQGYLTPTGTCECVGLGAALGGGHGRLEGFYGLVSDNIRKFHLVLADGSSIVVSGDKHSKYADLFWGMRGAGHNFGIVTSYEVNIFPRVENIWYYRNYLFSGEVLEELFEKLNIFHGNGSTPVRAAFTGGFFEWDATTKKPVIFWTFAWRGSAEDAEKAWKPFESIQRLSREQGEVTYPDLFKAQGTSYEDPLCAHGTLKTSSTAGLQVYNISVERSIFDGFEKRGKEDPELVAGTAIAHEGYATRGVTDVPGESSAFPFRGDHILGLFIGTLPVVEEGDVVGKERERKSWEWAKEVKELWNSGQPGRVANTYVNYASGSESLQEVYGREGWRLERLRALKKKYDPQNRFRFFNPIL